MSDAHSLRSGRSTRGAGPPDQTTRPGARQENGRRAEPPDCVGPDGGDPLVVLAVRLQERLGRQAELLDRMQTDDPRPGRLGGVAELLESTRRMRRTTESLLLLCGADPGARGVYPRAVSAVLGDAVCLVDEPRRVVLRPAPAATLAPRAATELAHLVAEVLDAALAAPGVPVEVVTQTAVDGGLTVEVRADAPGFSGPAPSPGLGVAAGLARRSAAGIVLHRPPAGPGRAPAGSVAKLYCPPAVVTVADPETPADARSSSQPQPPSTTSPPRRSSSPSPPPRSSSVADELFGPMLDSHRVPVGAVVGTPIFEAIASAWFRRSEGAGSVAGSGGPADWESPSDAEWRAAAARAARSDPGPAMASGLPRRRPGDQLLPPPPTSRADADTIRVPDRVRDRLATYQRGLHDGRHRAAEPPPAAEPDRPDREAWWSEPS